MSGRGEQARDGTRRERRAPTARQRRFVELYVATGNATRAAIGAGYSARNADKIGPALLGKTRVAAAIRAAQAALTQRAEATADGLVAETDRLALSDLRELFDPRTGQLKPAHQWPERAARAVAALKVRRYPVVAPDISAGDLKALERLAGEQDTAERAAYLAGLVERLRRLRLDTSEVVEVRLWDKNAALERAMKQRGMFLDPQRYVPGHRVQAFLAHLQRVLEAELEDQPERLYRLKVAIMAIGA